MPSFSDLILIFIIIASFFVLLFMVFQDFSIKLFSFNRKIRFVKNFHNGNYEKALKIMKKMYFDDINDICNNKEVSYKKLIKIILKSYKFSKEKILDYDVYLRNIADGYYKYLYPDFYKKYKYSIYNIIIIKIPYLLKQKNLLEIDFLSELFNLIRDDIKKGKQNKKA